MEYAVQPLESMNRTIYRVVERKHQSDPWSVSLPCIDYDVEDEAIRKMQTLQRKAEPLTIGLNGTIGATEPPLPRDDGGRK